MIAFIPARSGSTRIKDKNIRLLGGHPLLAYAIQSALDSKVFESVYVTSDSDYYLEIASYYGAKTIKEPLPTGQGDIKWLEYAFKTLGLTRDGSFSILRPTSPFRTSETIKRAYGVFHDGLCDSIRAVELCKQHPEKMWYVTEDKLVPYTYNHKFSQPYQSLPKVYVQNASLEMAWCRVILDNGNITGNYIKPFFTKGYEGFDINYEEDFLLAETLIKKRLTRFQKINKVPYEVKLITDYMNQIVGERK
jgi:N-acylneuraminate cytidylyltransferase